MPFTGPCESVGGVGPLVPRLCRLVGLLLAACPVRMFPADVKDAPDGGAGLGGLPAAAW